MSTSATDAAAVAGALADDARRAAFAAVQLGARTLDAVCQATGLNPAQAGKALGKLAEVGLVVQRDGALVVDGSAIQAAARAALSRPASTEHADAPAEARKVLTAFVQDGRLTSIPTSHGKRLVILDWLAQLFEPGRRYSEQMVNLLLGQRHADTAALRRYLVDEEFLTREDGIYWRSGGTVDPPTDAAGSGPG